VADVKHPEIKVELIGQDGNAFMVLGLTMKALRRAKVPQTEIDEFMKEAQSGDYDHLLATVMGWVTVTGPDEDEVDIDDIIDELDEDDDDVHTEDDLDDAEEDEDFIEGEEEETTADDDVRLDDIETEMASSD
jgi:hypothetical protein